MSELDEESLTWVKERDISFQGEKVKIGDLFNNVPELINTISGSFMYKLLTSEELIIGKQLEKFNNLYIKRQFTIQNVFVDNIQQLVDDKSNDIHLLTNCENLPELYQNGEEVEVGGFRFIKINNVYISFDKNSDYKMFLTFTEHFKQNNIHWFTQKHNRYQHKHSTASNLLLKTITEENIFEEDELCNSNDVLMIIRGELVVGKTSLVENLTYKYKSQNKNQLVLLCKLERLFRGSKEDDFGNINQILTQLAKYFKIDYNILKCFFKKNQGATIFFDGFDKVVPKFKNIFENMVKILVMSLNLNKIIIAGTINIYSGLQHFYTIKKFTREDQMKYLIDKASKFYDKKSDDEIKTVVLTIMTQLDTSLTDHDRSILGIPLLLKMVTNIYFEDDKISSKNKIRNILDIYELFFETEIFHFIKKHGYSDILLEQQLEEINNYFQPYLENLAANNFSLVCPIFRPPKNIKETENLIQNFVSCSFRLSFLSEAVDEEIPVGERIKPIKTLKFLHKTFEEFFLACYLSKYWKENKEFFNVEFYKHSYNTIRYFLDLIVSSKSPMLTSIIRGDNKFNIDIAETDELGRNCVHLCCMYGRIDLLNEILDSVGNDEKITLLETHECLRNDRPIDSIFITSFTESRSLFNVCSGTTLIGILYEHSSQTKLDVKTLFITFEEIVVVMLSCFQNNHISLLENLIQEYEWEMFKKKINPTQLSSIINQSGVRYKRSNFISNYENDFLDLPVWVICAYVADSKSFSEILWRCRKYYELHDYLLYSVLANSFKNINSCIEKTDVTITNEEENKMVDLLLVKYKNEATLLHIAAQFATVQTFQYLLSQFEIKTSIVGTETKSKRRYHNCVRQVDCKSRTLLHYAALSQEITRDNIILIILGEELCDPNERDKNGYTAFQVLQNKGRPISEHLQNPDVVCKTYNALQMACWSKETARKLLESGMSNSAQDCTQTTASTSMFTSQKSTYSVVEYLTQHNVHLNLKNMNSENALHWACLSRETDVKTIEILLNYGISINSVNYHNITPLMYASKSSTYQVVEYLLQQGGDVNLTDNDNFNALHWACCCKETDIEKLGIILDHGLSINSLGNNKKTALMYASVHSTYDIVRFLIQQGCDVNLTDSDNCNALHWACCSRETNIQTIEILVNHGISINSLDHNKRTPLFYAAKYSTYGVVKYLLQHGGDVNLTDSDNCNVLHWACCSRETDIETVEILLDHGILINSLDKTNRTVLIYAARYSTYSIVKYLLQHGVDVNLTDNNNRNALHSACLSKETDVQTIEILLDHSISINSLGNNSLTPLMYAAQYSTFAIVKYLLQHDADINLIARDHGNALHGACLSRETDIQTIEILLDYGISINSIGDNNSTPIMCAAKYSTCGVLKYLLQQGGDINFIDNKHENALHWACCSIETEIQTIENLLDHGVSVNSPGYNNSSPLMHAAKYSNSAVVEYLLQQGGDINLTDNNHDDALHWACCSKEVEIETIEILLNHGISINSRGNDNVTPLMYAAKYSTYPIVKYLLQQGGDVNLTDNDSDNSLHWACCNKDVDIQTIEIILEYGISINSRGNDNITPLLYAAKYSTFSIVRYLLQHGGDVNLTDKDNHNSLHWACLSIETDIQTIEILLDHGILINSLNNQNITPLMYAAQYSTHDVVKCLIRKGGDVNLIDQDNSSALHWACLSREIDIQTIDSPAYLIVPRT